MIGLLKKQIHMPIPRDMKNGFRRLCHENHSDMSNVIQRYIIHFVKKQEQQAVQVFGINFERGEQLHMQIGALHWNALQRKCQYIGVHPFELILYYIAQSIDENRINVV